MHESISKQGHLVLQEATLSSATNITKVPKVRSEARMDQFQLEVERYNEQRIFHVTGEAIERFAQMTNWDYYEAANRFQKVLEAAGKHCQATACNL